MTNAIEEFKKNISDFIEKTSLRNIMSFARDKMILDDILRGHSVTLSEGVGIYYLTEDPENKNADYDSFIQPFIDPASYNMKTKLSHPICEKYRSYLPHDKKCINCDEKIVKKYYEREWKKPTLHRCHLNILDMTCPLIIDDILLGVLFTGQNVVKGTIEWRKVLKKITDNPEYQVFWDPFDPKKEIPESSNHIDDIKDAIKRCGADAIRQKELMEVAEKDPEGRNVESEEIVSRFEDFINFRNMLIKLLGELYAARKEAAIRQLIQATATYLAQANLSSRKSWAEHCGELFSSFYTVSNLKEIHIYSRSHSNYERTIPYEEEKRNIIKARDILPVAPIEKLTNLNNEKPEDKELLAQLGLGTEDIWLFRTENQSEPSILACVIAINGKIENKNRQLLEFFCRTVGGSNDVASLVFRLQEQQEEFKFKVGEMAHSFRTPLQALILDIETIERHIKDNADLTALLRESKKRLYGAREDVRNLLEQVRERKEPYNLILLIEEVMNALKPIADAHPCKLVKDGKWSQEIIVKMDKQRVQRAFIGLVDNAIKYSWGSTNINGEPIYKVHIRVDASDYKMVGIMIKNYGLGIPPYLQETVLELGKRGMVPDSKRERTGTGFGLPLANYIFKEHGGRLEIKSNPADDDHRGPGEEYHRYVTEVKVYLPIYR